MIAAGVGLATARASALRVAAETSAAGVSRRAATRKALADVLGKGGQSGPVGDKMGDQDDEEYYPYVSLSFTPLNVQRGSA